MILRGATSLWEALEGVGPENLKNIWNISRDSVSLSYFLIENMHPVVPGTGKQCWLRGFTYKKLYCGKRYKRQSSNQHFLRTLQNMFHYEKVGGTAAGPGGQPV